MPRKPNDFTMIPVAGPSTVGVGKAPVWQGSSTVGMSAHNLLLIFGAEQISKVRTSLKCPNLPDTSHAIFYQQGAYNTLAP
eukprot:377291-Ditylum_brightwellii.AAC.1